MGRSRSNRKRTVLEQERREYVTAQHLRSQKKTTMVVGPAMVLVCIVITIIDPCWQLFLLLAGVLCVQGVLVWAVVQSKRGEIERASMGTMAAVVSFAVLSNLTVEGLLLPGLAAFLTSIFHASLFTRRSLLLGMPTVVGAIIAVILLQYFDAYDFKVLAPWKLASLQIVVTSLMLGQMFVYLFQAHNLNRFLITRLEGISTEQTEVIKAVNEMQPVITGAVQRIEEISSDFAGQASKQAIATSEVSSTVSNVLKTSKQTAKAAEQTKQIADNTLGALGEDRRRLREVEVGFEAVVELIEGAREQVFSLSTQVERIEDILAANHTISEHIKVLAVNAAIEAASAGEYGKGFHVVASELRDMIQSTGENLAGSKELLDKIRSDSGEASGSIQEGAGILLKYFDELRTTSRTIEKTMTSFVTTSEHVLRISDASKQQQTGVAEMTQTMGQLEATASELSNSAKALQEAVGNITDSHGKLRKTLEKS